MTEQTVISHNRKVALKIFFGVFLLLLATAPAMSWWGDSKEACLGAHSWVNYGKPITLDADGQPAVSVRPLLFTLMCMPTATLLPLPDPLESPYIRLGRAVIPALFGAGSAAVFFLILSVLGSRMKYAAMVAIALIFTTPLWIYSRLQYSEVMQTFLNLMLLFFLIRPDSPGRLAAVGKGCMIGCLLGLLINIRTTNALLVPFCCLYLLLNQTDWRSRIQSLAWLCVGLLPWFLAWAEFNHFRYGSPWTTGYEVVSVWRNPFNALIGQTLSPGKSLFLFAPLSLIGVILFVARVLDPDTRPQISWRNWYLILFFITNLVVYSSWWAWGGGWAWGPRFLVPFIPILILPVAHALASQSKKSNVKRAIGLAAIAGFIIQIPVALTGVHTLLQFLGLIDRAAFNTTPEYGAVGDDMILANFVPDFSPIVVQFKLLGEIFRHDGPFTMDFSSWAGTNGPYRIPGFSGRIIELDPIVADLWFVSADPSGQSISAWLTALILGVVGAGILFAIFKQSPDTDSAK